MNTVIFLILVIMTFSAKSSRILGVFPLPSVSHQLVYNAVMQELHDRGHDLTIITTNPIQINSTRYKQIDVGPVSYKKDTEYFHLGEDNEEEEGSPFGFISYLLNFFSLLYSAQLDLPEVQELFHSDQQFDLIIYEYYFTPAYLGLACKFGVPFIGIGSAAGTIDMHDAVGNPSHPGYIPDILYDEPEIKTFYDRCRSLYYYLLYKYLYYYIFLPEQDKISQKYITKDCPYVGEMLNKVEIILANTHFTISSPRPNVPAMIDIGGAPLQVRKLQPLPEDLKKFLDEATDGVVYFSLGSNVKSNLLPEYKRNQFLNTFKNLKQKVLWKWESDTLPGKPDNVKISKWLPQSDLLAHPNIKAFITQGGLQSIGEAVQNSIPLVIIPVSGDQDLNSKIFESKQVGIRTPFQEITSEKLASALNAVLNDPKYKENMNKYKTLLNDQPQQPMEKAIWWIEYVLRHKGAKHMRSAAVDIPIYQYLLLDVIGVVSLVLIVVVYLDICFMKLILRLTTSKQKTE